MRRIRITISYDGTAFHGWQVQPGLATIQSAIEAALGEIEGAPVRIAGSGRTDAGVHAIGQVAAFDLRNPIPCDNLRKALNRLLPPDIRILEADEASADFDARRHARAKTYEYRIFRGEVLSPFERNFTHHYPYVLDEAAVRSAAPIITGTHDFSAFAASDAADALGRSKVRTVFNSSVEMAGLRMTYRVRGSGFLKHMVRNIVGTLIEVGKGNRTIEDLRRMLEPGYPGKAGPRAPGCGLYLMSVEYDGGLPEAEATEEDS